MNFQYNELFSRSLHWKNLHNLQNLYGQYGDSMENDTFYGDFMVNSIWRLSLNLICHLFSHEMGENPRQSPD